MANQAPRRLGLVQEFVNTLDIEEGTDQLGTSEAVWAWLRERDLAVAGKPSASGQARAIALREALRRLLFANNGAAVAEADLALLNDVAAESGLCPRFSTDGRVSLEPAAAGVDGALGRLVGIVSDAMHDGTWGRLKACAEDTCQWAFYDQSKNRSGHWCRMEVCGNRAKARQFRQRRRAQAGGQDA